MTGKKRRHAHKVEGEKILDGLNAEQIKSLTMALNAKIDAQNNQGFGEEVAPTTPSRTRFR